MSNFIARTLHPVTGKWQDATWIDDHFGRHRYGVQFAGEDRVFDPDKVEMPTEPVRLVEHAGGAFDVGGGNG